MAVAVRDVVADQNDAEVGADGEGAREQGEDRIGMGTGGDVKIFGKDADQDVADTASGEVRLMPRRAQLEYDALCGELGWRVGHCNSSRSSWQPGFRVDGFEPRWDSDDPRCLLG